MSWLRLSKSFRELYGILKQDIEQETKLFLGQESLTVNPKNSWVTAMRSPPPLLGYKSGILRYPSESSPLYYSAILGLS